MAHVSAGVEYALHCLLYLIEAEGTGQPASARDLAELQRISPDYVAKLFTKLQKAGIVVAREGIGGGFALARPANEITALKVIEAVDGRKALFECKEIRGQCALFGDRTPAWAQDGVCSIHAVMIEAEKRAREVMASYTLAAISERAAAKAPKEHAGEVRDWLAARTPQRRRRGDLAKTEQR
ncbi:Rrf2 family transcriptional regulator [Ensifer sp. HO-A22]|jgi:Rrf2 family protein|uniref:Rrf2 family transcriptional regulator n=1 Tax=Ensifer oleiphilus TaxID=2742698 RepID=A0A7Y6Q6L3_9HYPH|nr:Rrf2 family transcriptional regulator [Ensifer oleiphilus]NVD40012.1 Rrf2 family transcriptional regulator [Ensifer oleiphilus]